MKFRWLILFLVVVMTACTPSAETRHGASLSDDAIQETHHGTSLPNDGVRETQNLASLQAIDSLMWKQHDSAFAVLRQFAASSNADSLDEFNGHYCQLLISELLYKNYYGQSNREGLLHAVDYFDSLTANTHTVPQQKRNVFLDARAHYINGVGFYERDSLIEACREYLNALRMMEGHFAENELVGHKARFIALTYTRLMDMFSQQFIQEQAIYCGKLSLTYNKIAHSSPGNMANILYHLGKQYDKLNEADSAAYYYEKALETMPGRNSMLYRDVVTSKALFEFEVYSNTTIALDSMKSMAAQATSDTERLIRFLTIGAIYHSIGQYDSAKVYLKPVFEKDSNNASIAAKYLRDIALAESDTLKANQYSLVLAKDAAAAPENLFRASQLNDLFQNYLHGKQEKAEAERRLAEQEAARLRWKRGLAVTVVVMMALGLGLWCWLARRKKEHEAETDRLLGETEQAHGEELRRLQAETKLRLDEAEKRHRQKVEEMEQTKQRHEAELEAERLAYEKERETLMQSLRRQEDQMKALEKSLGWQQDKEEVWRRDFLKEPICQRIYELLHGKQITSRDVSNQHKIALNEDDLRQLKEAVERHYAGFDNVLLSHGDLKRNDLTLCHLHLLGLSQGEIGALRGVTYSGVRKQDESLQRKFRTKEEIESYVLGIAEVLLGTQGGTQTTESDEQDLDAWIVKQITDNPKITTEKLAEKSHKGVRTIKRHIADMDHVRYVGSGYSGHWEVIK